MEKQERLVLHSLENLLVSFIWWTNEHWTQNTNLSTSSIFNEANEFNLFGLPFRCVFVEFVSICKLFVYYVFHYCKAWPFSTTFVLFSFHSSAIWFGVSIYSRLKLYIVKNCLHKFCIFVCLTSVEFINVP